jgi:2,5-furandicarboxylate decarboxylase 1
MTTPIVQLRPQSQAELSQATADVERFRLGDNDIDIFSDAQMEWGLATRFQADRDLLVANGFRAIPLDLSLRCGRTGAKAGFDLTFQFSPGGHDEARVLVPPHFEASRGLTVRQALDEGPQSFRDLMEATGSRDGRDVLIALDAVRGEVGLERLPDGRYRLTGQHQE